MQVNIFLTVVLFALGLFIIVKGGDFFVDAARWVSLVTGVPRIIIGATVVSLATTLPEITVSVIAALEGRVGMSYGNAIGTVLANIGVVLSVSIFAFKGTIDSKSFTRKAGVMITATLLLFVMLLDGKVQPAESLMLFLCLVIFFYLGVKSGGISEKQQRMDYKKSELIMNVLYFAGGASAIVIGADMLVENGSIIAKYIGIPETVIGITVIAIGTSLPELTTAITAAKKREHSLSVGNVIGANVIDICLILPLCSILSGVTETLPISYMTADIPVMFTLMLVAVAPTIIGRRFYRCQAVMLIAIYFAFLLQLSY